MFNNKERKILDNHSKAILKLADTLGQVIDCLNEHNIKFEYKEGKLLDEKKNDKETC